MLFCLLISENCQNEKSEEFYGFMLYWEYVSGIGESNLLCCIVSVLGYLDSLVIEQE